MLWKLKEASLEICRGKIDYAVFGKGSRPLVVIPGLTLRGVKGAGIGLALMYRRFCKDYRIYVLDKNSQIDEGCTVKDLARDTAEAMAALGIKNAAVIGISLGGMIAQEIAIEHPELVERLVLGVTCSRVNGTMSSVINKWISLAESGDFGGIVRDMLDVMYSRKYVRRYKWLMPVLIRLSKPKDEARFIRLAKACLTPSSYDILGRITAKALVLGGEEDKIVTPGGSLEIAEKLSCDVHMYEGLGHSAYEEARDFNKRIFDFLSKP